MREEQRYRPRPCSRTHALKWKRLLWICNGRRRTIRRDVSDFRPAHP
ncbi:MAG: hypothetical protein AVDCRST_MAG67-1188 [uncultured Solirubrobacteraceae bacterium]|uniref:Uncharacterized protein n=1 Tax=uncultured Solirubrobacteraceae bacterium TaxID=1162706 RepID=A0A6J4SCK3_9ACTN|nr:MAG: hypothetical protein AVDCRST_MAG67-1188 [uncultured Solirubrobacteraceae bacterium]